MPSTSSDVPSTALVVLAWLQGAFYVVAGLWPLVHMRCFLAFTGSKVDLWLVRTVGALVSVVGLSLVLLWVGALLAGPVT